MFSLYFPHVVYFLDVTFDGVFIVSCYLLIRCHLLLTFDFYWWVSSIYWWCTYCWMFLLLVIYFYWWWLLFVDYCSWTCGLRHKVDNFHWLYLDLIVYCTRYFNVDLGMWCWFWIECPFNFDYLFFLSSLCYLWGSFGY